LNSEVPNFAISKGCLKAVELLNEKMYTAIFDESKQPKDVTVLVFRLLFQLVNFPDIHQKLDNREYWRRIVSYLRVESGGKIGSHLKELCDRLDFSEENIYLISRLSEPLIKKLNPSNFSKICGTTGFIVFYIKDAFEYCGLIENAKTHPRQLLKFLEYKIKRLKSSVEKINEMSL